MTDQTFDLIAACAFGLEAVVRRELQGLGIESTIGESGRVHFQGDANTVCTANLWLRTADRILIRVAEFPAADFDALFESTKAIDWGSLLPQDAAFPVTGRSIKSTLTSVPACQRAVKRSIVDALRRDHETNELPETGPEYKIDVALLKDVAVLTLDTTGRSLHRRGYRTHVSRAPLKETLAAAMVLLSYWRAGRPLLDPFCGSGTIPIEAARIGRNLAPGRHREFACESWSAFPAELWQSVRESADAVALDGLEEKLIGSDIDGGVLRAARDNAERAGVAGDIHFQAMPMQEVTSKRRFGCLITNPPYGQRLGRDRDLEVLYESIPHVLRKLPTWSHYFLTAFPGFERAVGRTADRRRKLYNGRIECTYFQFHGPRPVQGKGPDQSDRPGAEEGPGAEVGLGEPDDAASETSTDANVREIASDDRGSAEVGDLAPEEILAHEASNTEASNTEASETEAKTVPKTSAAKPYVHAEGTAAFGHLGEKAQHQAELFSVRLKKRAKHLRRWPKKRGITCFRLYERDVPEIPLVVDRYEDHLHITEYERPHDRDPAEHANWLDLMAEAAGQALEIPSSHVHFKSRRRQRGSTQHLKVADTRHRIEVQEGGLTFLVNLQDYVDTGLFLDHRVTRQMVRDAADGKTFLNLFAYTGSFSVYAAAGGALRTTSVDLSRGYLDWAWENMRRNGFHSNDHKFVAGDVGNFIREHAQEETYDLVVLDPPTFSNSKRTDSDWNVQDHAVPLMADLMPLVRTGGVIYFSTNFRRFKFDEAALPASQIHEISSQTVPEDYRNRRIHRCWRIVK
ncbi:MAG: bifunctional 23S rRNA (guanine(2069)-N(7))-methyltransferase RlmK/23S rRNA (guanine(2445)-N(2))-methyltransferase RlmL [Rubripirellula sp.]